MTNSKGQMTREYPIPNPTEIPGKDEQEKAEAAETDFWHHKCLILAGKLAVL